MQKKRLKIGILFNFSSKWMGGVIYIINVVKTLDFLEDSEKPEIYLFYRPELSRFLEEMKYPYLNAIEWTFPSMIKGNIKSMLIRKNLFIEDILNKYPLDAVYPLQDYPVRINTKTKLVSWCADFQQNHYPEFFTKMQRTGRNMRTRLALRNTNDLVLSSNDAYSDLKKFFKVPGKLKIHIFHFVSVIDNLEDLNIKDLRLKYNLPEKYFLVSNQFHRHKNHKVLLLSLVKLKERGINIHIGMTGKLPDASDSPYITELHRIINDNNLHDQISLLGVISRNDQLQLMRHSQAVIQPSLFEGWSTVIEDAKSLQVPVIASSLRVNIEQLGAKGVYFDPHKPDELTSLLINYPERNLNDVFYEEYNSRILSAAKELKEILKPGS